MNYFIPSYKRSQGLKGKDYFTSAKYVIPISQLNDYLKVLPEERIITIPDEDDGNLCRKRNWIMKNCPRPFVMLDDDVYDIRTMQNRRFDVGFTQFETMEFEKFDAYMDSVADLCRELDVRFFGISSKTDEREYKEWLPFSMTNIVNGPFQGHMEHELLYDERMPTKDDYDMTLQQLREFKKVLRVNFLAFYKFATKDGNEGGLVSMRTQEYETDNCRAIMRKWGTKIIRYELPPKKLNDLLNPKKMNVPIKGV